MSFYCSRWENEPDHRPDVDYAATIAAPERIILFGSVAHQRNNVHNDVDLLIVSDSPETFEQVVAKLNSFCQELSLRIDVLIYSPAEIEEACREPLSFLAAVMKTRKVVFELDRGWPAAQQYLQKY